MVNSEELAKRLQKVIDFYGISASAFADSIGVQRSSISHILSGRNKPSLDFVMKIVDAYPEVELYWLLNGDGKFPKELENKQVNISTTPSPPTLFEKENLQPAPIQELPVSKKTNEIFKNSSISRIVIFYKDGTFEEYKN